MDLQDFKLSLSTASWLQISAVEKLNKDRDLAASLAPRKLLIADISDGNGSMSNIAYIEEDLKVIRAGYKNFPANLKIIRAGSDNIQQSLSNWLLSK